jgi:hypothetical protein
MRDPEATKSIIRSIRLSPSMAGMIREEAFRRRMNFSSYLRFVATASIRQSHSEQDVVMA